METAQVAEGAAAGARGSRAPPSPDRPARSAPGRPQPRVSRTPAGRSATIQSNGTTFRVAGSAVAVQSTHAVSRSAIVALPTNLSFGGVVNPAVDELHSGRRSSPVYYWQPQLRL